MKWSACLILIVLLAACASVTRLNPNLHLPDLAFAQSEDAAYRQAWEYIRSGDAQKAVRRIQESGASQQKKSLALGYAFLAQNRFPDARQQFEQTLKLNPTDSAADIGLALILEMQNESDAAFQVYGRLVAKYPENAWVKLRYEYIKSTATQDFLKQAEKFGSDGEKEKQIATLEKASLYSPEMVPIQMQIADFYYRAGNLKKAQAVYERVLEKLPHSEEALTRLADMYQQAGRFDSALLMVNRLLESKPGDPAFQSQKEAINRRFQEMNLPAKFKNIFFKNEISREDLAALISYYFSSRIQMEATPLIITDIAGSFAQNEINRVCTAGIIKMRPDHTFDRFAIPDRAFFAETLDALLAYLGQQKVQLRFTPRETPAEPADISPLHKNYRIIRFLVNLQILWLDPANNFNPTLSLTPAEAVAALQKILNSIISE